MKIKIIKIKVDSDNQTFNISDFFEGNNTIYKTSPTLVKEEDGYYWHVFFTYKNDNTATFVSDEKEETQINANFEKEIMELLLNHEPPLSVRFKNTIKANLSEMQHFDKIEKFMRFRNFGKKEFQQNIKTMNVILKIAQKYKN